MAINVIGSLLPVLVALVTVPIYLRLIGPARYGLVSVTWILLGYFGFLDFGLSRASSNALGRLGHAGPEERGPVFVTAFWMHVGFGLLGGLIMYFLGDLILRHAFTISGPLRGEMLAAFPWMVPMLPLGLVLAVASGSLESRERFVLSNALNAAGTLLGQGLPLLCVLCFGPRLQVVVPAILLARLLQVIVIYAIVIPSEWPLRVFAVDRLCARRLFGYGAWVTVSSLITPMLESFDQMLIGRMLGPVAISHYAVPMNLSMRSQVLATALARTLFPRMSRSDALTARDMTTSATVSLVYAFGAVCAGAIVVCGPFLRAWVGPEFASPAVPVAQILMVGAWANGVGFMPYNQLQAQGRPDLTAKIHAIEIVPFVLGVWLLIGWAGLPGAALAWTLRTTLDCIALLALSRCLRGSLARIVPAVVLVGAAYLIAVFVPLSLAASFVAGTILAATFLIIGMNVEPVLGQAASVLFERGVLFFPQRLRVRQVPP